MRRETRRRALACLAAVAVCLGIGTATEAQENLRPLPKRIKDYDLPGMTEKVVLTGNAPWKVTDLLEYLILKGNLKNVVITKGVTGETKIRFDNVAVGDALEVVLSVNRLAYDIRGGIITIMSDAEYRDLTGKGFYDQKQVRTVVLRHADVARVTSLLQGLKSSEGTIVPDAVGGALVLVDTPDKIQEMMAVVEQADTENVWRGAPTVTETFVLQYASLEDIQPQVQSLLSKEAGSVRADRRTRTMIVTDLARNIEKVREMVQIFDRRPKQVFIEAKVVDVTLSDDFALGINWEHLFQGLDPRFALRTASKPSGVAEAAGKLTYKTIVAGGDLSVILQALKNVGETKVLSNPQIAVMDGQEAMIEVVENQPYKEIALEAGTTNVTGVTYKFEKVGVQLSVTPRVNDDNFISVDIKPEVSQITQWYDGRPQEGTPVIRRSLAQTSIMVQDGVTVIIGGMIKNEKAETTEGVPLLSRLPFLGPLFRTEGVSTINRETVVFLTPRLISGEEPFLRMRDMKKPPKPLRPVGSGASGVKEMKPIR
jgi:type II secretory pathway component GspD/PulD (secretin)